MRRAQAPSRSRAGKRTTKIGQVLPSDDYKLHATDKGLWRARDAFIDRCGLTLRPYQIHAVFQVMLLTSRSNMAEAMFSAALWAVSKVIRLAGPAIEASHPASVLRTLRDKPPTSVRNFVTDCIDASLATVL